MIARVNESVVSVRARAGNPLMIAIRFALPRDRHRSPSTMSGDDPDSDRKKLKRHVWSGLYAGGKG
jgi:hypothetical protein